MNIIEALDIQDCPHPMQGNVCGLCGQTKTGIDLANEIVETTALSAQGFVTYDC